MFKSVFAKYILAFMLIILVSFTLLTVIVGSIANGYSASTQEITVSAAASAAADGIGNMDKLTNIADVTAFCSIYHDEVCVLLDAIVKSNNEELSLFIVTNDGRIITANTDVTQALTGRYLPKQLMDELSNSSTIKEVDGIDGILNGKKYICSSPIYINDNYICGSVFACVNTMSDGQLSVVTTRTIVLASLWVMLAALIAVYFITNRIIGPLKEMSHAAKSFAAGDFAVRVPVVGNDEVAELAKAFNNMAQSLASLDDMRSNFMSSVSHDMRTPMTTISGFIDCILSGAIPPDKHKHYLTVIRDEVQRLSRLVATLLDISRIQAGDRKFVMAPFDICEMARQVLISCEQRIDGKHLDVEFNIDDDNMYVIGDHDAIYQILYNIVDNAIKFSFDGGMLRIRVKYIEGRRISTAIYNDGEGIPKEDQPYIFERFYKSDRSRGKDKSGVGLGMFIAKTIIKAHGEDITLRSEPGKNCEFEFTLPRAQLTDKHASTTNTGADKRGAE